MVWEEKETDPERFGNPGFVREVTSKLSGQGQFGGQACFDSVEAKESCVATSSQDQRLCEAVFHYHCPTGCPTNSAKPRIKAMSLRHGSSAGFDDAGGHGDHQGPTATSGLDSKGPWMLPQFQVKPPGKSQDKWCYMEHDGKRYWIKTHHNSRVRLFHPIHRSQPMETQQLLDYRVTVMFPVDGKGSVVRKVDQWMDQHNVSGERWVGYTFFEMKPMYQAPEDTKATPWKSEEDVFMDWRGDDTSQGKGRGGKQTVIEGPLVAVYVNPAKEGASGHQEKGGGKSHGFRTQGPISMIGEEWAGSSDGWSMVSEPREQ